MGRIRNKEIGAALYKQIAPLLPVATPSAKGGRPRLSDEQALNGILFVLRTGIPWEELPQELGFGSGMTCWRRLRDWQSAGVWHRLHMALLTELRSADKLDFSRAWLRGQEVSEQLRQESAGLLASASIIAPIIPPSIGFVIFGVAANVSISKLFLAGIAPGVLLGMALCFTWWWVARKAMVTPPKRTLKTVKYDETARAPIHLEKGAELGRFKLGSTAIVLFGPEQVQWAAELAANSPVRMGQGLGMPGGVFATRIELRDPLQCTEHGGDEIEFLVSANPGQPPRPLARVASGVRPDPTQFDPQSPYFDPKSPPEAPRWLLLDVKALRKTHLLGLPELRANPALADMTLLQRGSRLSITPVSEAHWQLITQKLLGA